MRPRAAVLPALLLPTLLVALLLALGACTGTATTGTSGSDAAGAPAVLDDPAALARAGVARLRPQVVATAPHDRTAFTEGLELAGGSLWESTGRTGASQLRELDPDRGTVRRSEDLPTAVFGEGVTVLPDRIWQLTWRDHVVYDRDPATLQVRRTLTLDREGWGLCHGTGEAGIGDGLVSSDGSDELVVRDPVSFAPRRTVRVSVAGTPVGELNELECTPEGVWANVWETDHLVRIDPTSGAVTAVVDAAGLRPADRRAGTDVLNGVAAIPGTDEFWLTGKLWPTSFRVRFVPA